MSEFAGNRTSISMEISLCHPPKVSVIVPVYRTEQYLHQCLNSLRFQTYDNLEILCVNDGSPDGSLEILRSYAQRDSRFIIIDKENEGASIARNVALRRASGHYFLFLDSDDWMDLDAIEYAVNSARTHGADLVMWSYVREFPGNSQKKILWEEDRVFEGPVVKEQLHRRMVGLLGDELRHPENADALCTIWGKLYRADLIRRHGITFFDIRQIGTYEDGLFNLEVLAHVEKAVFLNRFFNHYRKDNANSLTRAYRPKLREQWDRLFEVMEAHIRKNSLSAEYYQALDNRISLSAIGLGLNEMAWTRSFSSRRKAIKAILSAPRYRNAVQSLHLCHFPLHWRLFFSFAKWKLPGALCLMLLGMNQLIGRKAN